MIECEITLLDGGKELKVPLFISSVPPAVSHDQGVVYGYWRASWPYFGWHAAGWFYVRRDVNRSYGEFFDITQNLPPAGTPAEALSKVKSFMWLVDFAAPLNRGDWGSGGQDMFWVPSPYPDVDSYAYDHGSYVTAYWFGRYPDTGFTWRVVSAE